MLLRPLFLTSYLIDDFLADAGFFGAEAIVISSASSKTASALAFLLSLREGVARRRADLRAQRRVHAHTGRIRPRARLRPARVAARGPRGVRGHRRRRRAARRRARPLRRRARPLGGRRRDPSRPHGRRPRRDPRPAPDVLLRARPRRQARRRLGRRGPAASAWPTPGTRTSRGRPAGCRSSTATGPTRSRAPTSTCSTGASTRPARTCSRSAAAAGARWRRGSGAVASDLQHELARVLAAEQPQQRLGEVLEPLRDVLARDELARPRASPPSPRTASP